MELVQSIILGITQGLTEFLPVSSSGHLILMPWLFSFPDPGLIFDILLHIGTTFALIIFFKKDLFLIIKGFVSLFIKTIKSSDYYQKLSIMIIIATIPAVIIGSMNQSLNLKIFRHPLSISFFLTAIAVFMYICEKKGKKVFDIENLKLSSAFLIGCFQAIALIPGVSRSGITIAGALLLGFKRQSAAKFSFLLSTPIIAGAAIYKSKNIFTLNSFEGMRIYLWLGLLASAVTGYLAIKYLLKYLKNHSLNIFVYYRIILAVIIIMSYILK
ncbi:undecaprenyl-diphosphatase UppP [bacterium]